MELFVVQFGGAARLSNLAHVATFVFIWPARRKFLPKMKGTQINYGGLTVQLNEIYKLAPVHSLLGKLLN